MGAFLPDCNPMAGADAPGTALPDERNAAGSREAARAQRGPQGRLMRGWRGAAAAAPRHPRTEGDYFTTISVPAWEGTSAQTPVGRSPAFSGASSTDGQP